MLKIKLPKQLQKQIVIACAVIGCGVLYILIQFVIVPMWSGWKTDITEIKEMRSELDDIRAAVRERPEIQEQIDETCEKIRQVSEYIPLPVLGNYRLDMEQTIRACVNETDVHITSVADNDILDLKGESGAFKVYRVRVVAQSGYHDLVRLFHNIEESRPWVSISGLNIIPQQKIPEKHHVSFIVAWLIWSDPAERPVFVQEAEDSLIRNGK